jgi:hypothetical protein
VAFGVYTGLVSPLVIRLILTPNRNNISTVLFYQSLLGPISFLVNPVLFLAVTYILGKRAARHLRRLYLKIIIVLLVAGALSFTGSFLLYYVMPGSPGLSSWGGPLGPVVSTLAFIALEAGVNCTVVCFAGLSLGYLRAGPTATGQEGSQPS